MAQITRTGLAGFMMSSDGDGGTDLKAFLRLPSDNWTGTGSWTGNPGDWSLAAPPTSADDAVIVSGTSTLTSSSTVRSLTTDTGGTLVLQNGALLTSSNGLVNNGGLGVDTTGIGGSTVNIAGTLDNNSIFKIGNQALATATIVTAAGLINTGSFLIQGNAALAATQQATLDITGAAPATLTGFFDLSGDALLQFASGGITAIGANGALSLRGAEARAAIGPGTIDSALSGLSSNAGMFDLEGNSSVGAGAPSLITTTGLVNTGDLSVDNFTAAGGTTLRIGGVLSNIGSRGIVIGNASLQASTTVTATGLANLGKIEIVGNTGLGASQQATLDITGVARPTVTGTIALIGDALLEFANGEINAIGARATLDLSGAQASAPLSGLSRNAGTFSLVGGSRLGGGASISTTTGFINDLGGALKVDAGEHGDGGSTLTLGGILSNAGAIAIGNATLSDATVVTAAGLSNGGSIRMIGSHSSIAELVTTGDAFNHGSLNVGPASELYVAGADGFAQTGGSTVVSGSLIAPSVSVDGGSIDFKNALTADDGTGPLYIGANGTLEFDSPVSQDHIVTFTAETGTLALGSAPPSGFKATIAGFSGNDVIHLLSGLVGIGGLSYSGSPSSGVLSVKSSVGSFQLEFSGNFGPVGGKASFTAVSDGHGGTYILDPPPASATTATFTFSDVTTDPAAGSGANGGNPRARGGLAPDLGASDASVANGGSGLAGAVANLTQHAVTGGGAHLLLPR